MQQAVSNDKRPKVIKAKDRPEFTQNDFWRNEINYLRMLMHKHKAAALRYATEISLTETPSKV